jgi:hypothetical protein
MMGMAKDDTKRSERTGGWVVAGKASDGVLILKQAARSKHFTAIAAERVVESVKSGKTLYRRSGERVPAPGRGDK